MSAHTPGPWTYEPSDDENSGMIWAKTGFIVEFNENPSEANARLIAAAPELLQELINIASAMPSTWDDPSEFKAWAQSRAQCAIAKATGQ